MVYWPTQRQTEQQSNEAPAFTIDASVHAHALIDALACYVDITEPRERVGMCSGMLWYT